MSFRLLAHNQLTIRLYQREQNVSLDNSISKVEIELVFDSISKVKSSIRVDSKGWNRKPNQ